MMPHALVLLGAAALAGPPPEPVPASPSAATAAPAPVTLRFQYRCPGAEWVDLVRGARDCTGRYPMFPEGDFSKDWCPQLVGAFPNVGWRFVQGGSAKWRVVDGEGVVRTTITGPCVDDPRVYDLLDSDRWLCNGPVSSLKALAQLGCTEDAYHTGPALFNALLTGSDVWGFSFATILQMPPYATR